MAQASDAGKYTASGKILAPFLAERCGMAENSKRELIDTSTDKRYVRRDEEGKFKESDDVGRSSAQDQKRDAENASKPGHGDRGDRAD
jgi:hypothetical protein